MFLIKNIAILKITFYAFCASDAVGGVPRMPWGCASDAVGVCLGCRGWCASDAVGGV